MATILTVKTEEKDSKCFQIKIEDLLTDCMRDMKEKDILQFSDWAIWVDGGASD